MKKQQGITLIALIITIIVLLILAGVSISIVVGDNGVLNQAQNAIKKSNLETAKEEVSMAWASCQADYMASLTSNESAEKGSYFRKVNMDKYLGGKGTVDEFTYGTGTDEETIIVYTKAENSNEIYSFKVSSSGKVEELGKGLIITANTSQITAGGTGVELKTVLTEITGTATWSAQIKSGETWTNDSTNKVTISAGTGNTTSVTASADAPEDLKIVATITDSGTEYTAEYILKVVQPPVKYAVQIYGINQDVDASGNTLGLTFGPATGDNYNNAYVTHEYEAFDDDGTTKYKVKIVKNTVSATEPIAKSSVYLKDSSGNDVIRTEAEKNKYNKNLHTMTWAQISAVTDKTEFTDCMLCGDTKSVSLTINSTIKGSSINAQLGDGAGVLKNSIDGDSNYYRRWNPSSSQNSAATDGGSYGSNARQAGGYKTSHIRATLIGKTLSVPTETYAGNVNLDTTDCLYSCIESELQNVITAKKVKYATGTSANLNGDIADKIWLFSGKEIGFNINGLTEGLGSSHNGAYTKFTADYTKAGTSGGNVNSNRILYTEAGSTDFWWLRSPSLSGTYDVYYVSAGGNYINGDAYSASGLAFGFCIK